MKLLIVESPAKAKKIQGYLGNGWQVKASFGHVRDLPATKEDVPEKYAQEVWARLGINVNANYQPLYVTIKAKAKAVRELKDAAKHAEEVYLAADPDREGESIAWHIAFLLGLKQPKRIIYHEITKTAIQQALARPRSIDLNLVAAQETRRILDRLAGYGVSPLLWKAVGGAQSAGRVQSAALMLLAQREQSRLAFIAAPYWRVTCRVGSAPAFTATVIGWKQLPLATASSYGPDGKLKADANVVELDQVKAAQLVTYLNGRPAQLLKVEVSPITRKPPPPFTTSSLQQAANRKLKLGAANVTKLAQSLYEGGFITYIRTDSPSLSDEALKLARDTVEKRFGAAALPAQPRQYATKNANAQEAHEAIRPAGHFAEPASTGLSGDELALYTLIYERTLASQMQDATGEKTTVILQAGAATLRAQGTRITHPGFTALYDDQETIDEEEQSLPALQEGQQYLLSEIKTEEKKSSPPGRYSEGSFIQLMEKAGIGRPSTYGQTLETLQGRGYVAVRDRQLHVTPLGLIIAAYLMRQIPHLVDQKFTAQMESDLDEIAHGKLSRVAYLDRVWKEELQPAVQKAQVTAPKIKAPQLDAFLTAKEGQVYLVSGEQRALLPPGLLMEDVNPSNLSAVLSGTYKPASKKGKRTGASSTGGSPKKTTGRGKKSAGGTAPRKKRSGT